MTFFEKNFTPMLLKEVDKPFNSKDYLYEIKFDGIRTIIYISKNKIKIVSRNKKDITYLYPELHSIKNLFSKDTILDGEIVIFDNNKPSFSKLQERNHLKNKKKIELESINNTVTFICFDILYYSKNLTNLPLIKRKDILNKFNNNEVFFISKTYENGIDLFEKIKKLDLEGIVAKLKNSPYLINKRTAYWLKIKNLKQDNFIIGGYEIKKKNYISLLLGELKNKKLYYVGKASLTNNNELYNKVITNPKLKKSPFINYNEANTIYIKTNLKCKVKYLEKTKDNILRQPIIIKENNNE